MTALCFVKLLDTSTRGSHCRKAASVDQQALQAAGESTGNFGGSLVAARSPDKTTIALRRRKATRCEHAVAV